MTYQWDFPTRDKAVAREQLRKLIRFGFEQYATHHPERVAERRALGIDELVDAIKRYGTQLPGVARDITTKVRREQVRQELLEMDDVSVIDAVRANERFALTSWIRPPRGPGE